MTQQELAKRVGVTRQTINAIERSKHQPYLELAFKIAGKPGAVHGVFGKPIERVFYYFPDLDLDPERSPSVIIEISFEAPAPQDGYDV